MPVKTSQNQIKPVQTCFFTRLVSPTLQRLIFFSRNFADLECQPAPNYARLSCLTFPNKFRLRCVELVALVFVLAALQDEDDDNNCNDDNNNNNNNNNNDNYDDNDDDNDGNYIDDDGVAEAVEPIFSRNFVAPGSSQKMSNCSNEKKIQSVARRQIILIDRFETI